MENAHRGKLGNQIHMIVRLQPRRACLDLHRAWRVEMETRVSVSDLVNHGIERGVNRTDVNGEPYQPDNTCGGWNYDAYGDPSLVQVEVGESSSDLEISDIDSYDADSVADAYLFGHDGAGEYRESKSVIETDVFQRYRQSNLR